MFKVLVSKYTLTAIALAIWVLLIIVTGSSATVMFGVAIGAFLFEHGIDSTISEPVKRLLKIDSKPE